MASRRAAPDLVRAVDRKFSSQTRWIAGRKTASRCARPIAASDRPSGLPPRSTSTGDRQVRADRLDPVRVLVRVDERPITSVAVELRLGEIRRRLRRISFARRSSRTSARVPAATPALRRQSRAPPRSRSAATPTSQCLARTAIFPAIDWIAAHCESCASCSPAPAHTRSRTSAENLLARPMVILSRLEPLGNPGRFTLCFRRFRRIGTVGRSLSLCSGFEEERQRAVKRCRDLCPPLETEVAQML